jgi:hypothetical protein
MTLLIGVEAALAEEVRDLFAGGVGGGSDADFEDAEPEILENLEEGGRLPLVDVALLLMDRRGVGVWAISFF